MKHDGIWEFSGHSFPGDIFTHLKYKGHSQKRVLTNKALEKGARIVNRVMIFDLLRDESGVCGALGVDTRQDRMFVFKAKSVIVGTGVAGTTLPFAGPGLDGEHSGMPVAHGRWPGYGLQGWGRYSWSRKPQTAHGSPRFRPVRTGHMGWGPTRPARKTDRTLCDKA